MEKLLEILNQIKPGIDFSTEDDLIKKNILTSFDIVKLVVTLSEEFDIDITPVHIVEQNFKSAKTIMAMIQKLEDED